MHGDADDPDEQNQEELGEEEDRDSDWTESLLQKRDKFDQETKSNLGRAGKTTSSKRINVVEEAEEVTKRSKKKRYAIISEDWGLVGTGDARTLTNEFLYSGLDDHKPQRSKSRLGRPSLPLS